MEGRGTVHGGLMRQFRYRRVVAKLGTNLLTAGSDRLNLEVMASLVGQVAQLREGGLDVIVVSSGAVAAGRHRLNLSRKTPRSAVQKQVLAAVGQSHLMHAYDQLFQWHSITVAQTLLTRGDLTDRLGFLNARNTLLALLDLGVVPIVNENDVVAVDELAETNLGDNDTLSALVVSLVEADLLVILTDIAGLFTSDPRLDPAATLIERIDRIDAQVERLAGAAGSARGRGGMQTKVRAARLATAAGSDVMIADGRRPGVLVQAAEGERIGTLFPAVITRLEGKKRWLLGGLIGRPRILIDEGAVRALLAGGRSLLPVGVRSIDGRFERGDTVVVADLAGRQIACGIANYSSSDLALIRGQRSDRIAGLLGYHLGDEVIHRNNLVLLDHEIASASAPPPESARPAPVLASAEC